MQAAILRKYRRYDAQARAFLDTLSQYSDEQLNRKPADGGWSPMQVLYHLVVTEEVSLAYIRKKLSFNPEIEKVGLSTYWRQFLLHAFMWSPVKFKAPTLISDRMPASGTLADVRERWERTRADWQEYIGQIPAPLLDREIYRHPMVGRLGWLQTVGFLHGHFERHRRQALRGL